MRALRLAQGLAIGRGKQRDRLGLVAYLVVDQDWLVVLDQADDVVAGQVCGGHHDDLRPVEGRVEVYTEQLTVSHGRSDRLPVPGAREDEIVGVERGAR